MEYKVIPSFLKMNFNNKTLTYICACHKELDN